MTQLSPNARKNGLQDNVILIINGLSESGRVLAVMLAQEGADVAIVGFAHKPDLARRICHEVEAEGQRCLILTSDAAAEKKSFLESAMHRIVDTLGYLDTFIRYAAPDTTNLDEIAPTITHEDGRFPQPDTFEFDQDGLTIAALRQIHTKNE